MVRAHRAERQTLITVPIAHKFLEKRVCIFAGRVYA